MRGISSESLARTTAKPAHTGPEASPAHTSKPDLPAPRVAQANTTSHRFLFSNFRYSLTLFSKFFLEGWLGLASADAAERRRANGLVASDSLGQLDDEDSLEISWQRAAMRGGVKGAETIETVDTSGEGSDMFQKAFAALEAPEAKLIQFGALEFVDDNQTPEGGQDQVVLSYGTAASGPQLMEAVMELIATTSHEWSSSEMSAVPVGSEDSEDAASDVPAELVAPTVPRGLPQRVKTQRQLAREIDQRQRIESMATARARRRAGEVDDEDGASD